MVRPGRRVLLDMVLAVGMSLTMSWDRVAPGVIVGILGIVLLRLNPVIKGLQ